MRKNIIGFIFVTGVVVLLAPRLWAQECVECHKKITPNIVSDWQLSKHAQNAIDCSVCHGDEHQSANYREPTCHPADERRHLHAVLPPLPDEG